MNKPITVSDIVIRILLWGILASLVGALLYTLLIFVFPPKVNIASDPTMGTDFLSSISGYLYFVFLGLCFGLLFGITLGFCDGIILGVVISTGLLKPHIKILHRITVCLLSAVITAIGTAIGTLGIFSLAPNVSQFDIYMLPSLIAAIGGLLVAYRITSPHRLAA